MDEKNNHEAYESNFPNSHYLANLNNLNRTNLAISLNRLPTLGEILANKTKTPVDLATFYQFMKDVENKVDYLDFWFALIGHLNLCKHYVKGLRESLVRQSQFSDQNQGILNEYGNRDSLPNLDKSKHKSLSSSILLDLIVNDNFLEDNDSNRLSQFLRGDLNMDNLDPKLKDLIEHYNLEEQQEGARQSQITNRYSGAAAASAAVDTPAANFPLELPRIVSGSTLSEKRVSSNLRLLDDTEPHNFVSLKGKVYNGNGNPFQSPNPNLDRSLITPSLLERLIRDSPGSNNSFITRERLKESSHELLLQYFVEDLEKNLYLPRDLNAFIIKSIEVDGRDDPDLFNHVKLYVFNKIENDHLPKFLNFMAIRNINHSNLFRILCGFFFLFIGFWLSYIFVFLDYRKGIRPVIIVPFLIAFYCLISSIYLIDPILVWLGFSESFSKDKLSLNGNTRSSLIRIREKFIYKLLLKRSLWVLFLVLLATAIFTLIFCLVPGHRL